MANKKILYTGTDGILKELPTGSGTYYDDAANGTFYAKSITFNSMSFNKEGIVVVTSGSASVLPFPESNPEFYVLSWDGGTKKGWKYVKGNIIDVTQSNPNTNLDYTASVNADITGSLKNPQPKSLSNVTTGSLQVLNGGTGLYSGSARNDFIGLNSEYILTGSLSGKFGFLTASQTKNPVVLVSNNNNWTYITQSINNEIEIQVFTASSTWQKPAGTKAIRVIAQGAGGGGGAGTNTDRLMTTAVGGAGGCAGSVVDAYFSEFNKDSVEIVVGTGGTGGTISSINSINLTSGSSGGYSSFGSYITASGGYGGKSGNILNTVSSGNIDSDANVQNSNNTNIYNLPVINDNKNYGASATTSSLTQANPVLNEGIFSSGGGAGGCISAGKSYNGSDTIVDQNDVMFHLKINEDGTATNIINNGTVISSSNSGKTASKTIPFNYYPYNSAYISASTGISYYGISQGSRALEGDFTYELNVKFDALPSGYSALITLFNSDTEPTNTSTGVYYVLQAEGPANYRLILASNAGAEPLYSPNNAFTNGPWYHVALVRNKGKFSAFIDGKKVAWAPTAIHNNTLYVHRLFGVQGAGGAGNAWNGYATNIRLTKRALYTQDFSVPKNFLKVSSGTNVGGAAISSSYTSSYLLNVQQDMFSSNSDVKDLFKSSGGGGGNGNTFTSFNNLNPPILLHLDNSRNNSGVLPTYQLLTSSNRSFSNQTPFGSGFSLSSSYSAVTANTCSLNYPVQFRESNFTIDCWINVANSGSSGDARTTSNKANGGTYGAASWFFYMGDYAVGIAGASSLANGNNKYIVFNGTALDTNYFYTASNNILTVSYSTWNHIALVKNGANLKLYVNGTGSTNSILSSLDSTYTANYISNASTGQSNINGYLDEFRIILSASSDLDIKNIYESRTAYTDPSPIAGNYPGNNGGSGSYGSGGGGGGASFNALSGAVQGGRGGDGYVAVISYKY